jgi:hypothetical protein
MKLNINELVILRDSLADDINERENQIKSGFTTEYIDRPLIEKRKILKERLNKSILKYQITGK